MKKQKFVEGDVLRLTNHILVRVIDEEAPGWGDAVLVQDIQKPDLECVERERLFIIENLGQTPAVLASFYAARSVHLRINSLGIK